jgi:hypothetical protein
VINMGTVGRVIVIVAGIVGILSILLFMVLPDFFAFWRIDVYGFAPVDGTLWLGGIAQRAGQGDILAQGLETDLTYTEDLLLTIINVITLAGGAICVIGGILNKKIIGIVGGILMVLGVVAFIVALQIQFGDFSDLGDMIDVFGGDTLLFGSGSNAFPAFEGDWGFGMGAWIGIGAAVAGVVGGAISGD